MLTQQGLNQVEMLVSCTNPRHPRKLKESGKIKFIKVLSESG